MIVFSEEECSAWAASLTDTFYPKDKDMYGDVVDSCNHLVTLLDHLNVTIENYGPFSRKY